MYSDRLTYYDVIHLLLENLTTLYESEVVPENVFNRKQSLSLLARAVNRADRMISSVRKPVETIALFIPKDVHYFPLNSHGAFAGEAVESIVDTDLLESHPASIDFILNKEPWIDLRSILSETISVYAKHPSLTVKRAGTVRRVDSLDFDGGLSSTSSATLEGPADASRSLSYNPETRLLRLSKGFDEDVFLVFEAQVLPRLLSLKEMTPTAVGVDDLKATGKLGRQPIHTPSVFEDLLVQAAMMKLIPGISDAAVTPQQIAALTSGMETGNGPSVVIPDGNSGGFPL